MPKPRRTLTPADITSRFPGHMRRGGGERLEVWSAASRDGVWKYERMETHGTPWTVVHVPTGLDGAWYGKLDDARAATADGTALAYVERLLAHDRGEHQEQRNPACGRC